MKIWFIVSKRIINKFELLSFFCYLISKINVALFFSKEMHVQYFYKILGITLRNANLLKRLYKKLCI